MPSDNHRDDQTRWTVDHVETVPMSAEQYADSVAALAALIAQWQTNNKPTNTLPETSPKD